MSEQQLTALIFAVPVVACAVVLVFVATAMRRSSLAVEDLHKLINSRMDDWKKAEKAISRQQGHEEGVAQEQVDQRSRRYQIIRDADSKSEI